MGWAAVPLWICSQVAGKILQAGAANLKMGFWSPLWAGDLAGKKLLLSLVRLGKPDIDQYVSLLSCGKPLGSSF